MGGETTRKILMVALRKSSLLAPPVASFPEHVALPLTPLLAAFSPTFPGLVTLASLMLLTDPLLCLSLKLRLLRKSVLKDAGGVGSSVSTLRCLVNRENLWKRRTFSSWPAGASSSRSSRLRWRPTWWRRCWELEEFASSLLLLRLNTSSLPRVRKLLLLWKQKR